MLGSAAKVQSLEEIYNLLRTAVIQQRPIAAVHDGGRRLVCPHVLGRNKADQYRAFCYQYGGESKSGLQPKGGAGSWRCIALEKLSSVELLDGPWQTEPHGSQRCVAKIDVDAEDHPDREPQRGQ